ncbi:hypothetical protein [Comamonas sp. MYb396]|uniref:hypothetical protein n=1 Tax=Comamonas sp. MYb396 TaxID=2745302 RepID=UPI00309BCA04
MSENHKQAASKRGADRMARTLKLVTDAMTQISEEIKCNSGIYQRNGGAVSMAEIARRAGINEATLYKKINVGLKEKAAIWLAALNISQTVGRKRVRQNLQQRALDWKERHDALQSRHILTELQLQKSISENEILRNRCDSLMKQLDSSKVINISSSRVMK